MTVTTEAPPATLLEQYVAAVREKKRLKAESEKFGKQADELQAQLLEEFAQEGVRAKSTDDATVAISGRLWARPVGGVDGRPAAVEALKAAGLEALVYEDLNVHTISSFFNEEIKRLEESGVPVTQDTLDALLAEHYPALVGAIALTRDIKLGVTKR